MAQKDNLLQGTLTGTSSIPPANPAQATPVLPITPRALQAPDLTGDNQTNIRNLSAAQKQPSALMNLQKAMQLASRTAYNERQTSELTQAGTQFDPTKVSGNTFASIVGNLEANRGTDVSKIYKSTMDTYSLVQQQITDRLERAQELEENRRQFEATQKMEKEKLKLLKKQDKDAYKIAKGDYEMKKTDWERSYAKEMAKVKTGFGKAQMYPLWGEYET
jgi:hypothetical protein